MALSQPVLTIRFDDKYYKIFSLHLLDFNFRIICRATNCGCKLKLYCHCRIVTFVVGTVPVVVVAGFGIVVVLLFNACL